MYVAVKGGEFAISQSQRLVAETRRGDEAVPELDVAQVTEQLFLGVSRVMAEGALYDPELAALALKQARGDTVEAVHLLRAFRNTLPRLGMTEPVATERMVVRRRISAVFKDIPGGQILGPTFDYTHRLLDFELLESDREPAAVRDSEHERAPTREVFGQAGVAEATEPEEQDAPMPRVLDLLGAEGLIEPEVPDHPARPVGDITRDPPAYPAARDLRLQILARGDEGFLLALAYSTQRGFGNSHPFAGEIRIGDVRLEVVPEELGFPIDIGDMCVTECQMVNQFSGSKGVAPTFTRGYGLAFGENERKAMAMALVDRALRARELGEAVTAPAQDEEFVLSHTDNVEASGFVQHLKLPHYVDFQAELEMLRQLRRAHAEREDTETP